MRLFPFITIAVWLIPAVFLPGFPGESAAASSAGSAGETSIKELPGSAGWPEVGGAGKGALEYSSGDFIVEGIVFHSDTAKRSAYIRIKGSEHGKVLHVGDRVGPFRLSVIEDKSVTLYHVNRLLILRLDRLKLE